MASLDTRQADALGEIVNLGIGLAAAALSEMAEEEILLSVPRVDLLPRSQAAEALEPDRDRRLVAIVETFSGDFSGQALLLFPEEKSLRLARTLLGDVVQLDSMTELEENALLEVGNVVLNACLGVFGDVLGVELMPELPRMMDGTVEELLGSGPGDDDAVVACLCAHFSLRFHGIGGFVTFVLDLGSVRRLKTCIDSWLARLASLEA